VVSLIILSMDRALQLDLLLRSMERNCGNLFSEVIVLYGASSGEFESGYDEIRKQWESVKMVGETDFEQDMHCIIGEADNEMVCILADDCIFYRDISAHTDEIVRVVLREDVYSFILGIGGDSTYSGMLKYNYQVPTFQEDGKALVWNWKEADRGEFQCPFMLAANIYKKEDYLGCVRGISFKNPSTFESSLQKTWQRERKGEMKSLCACLPQQSLVHSLNNRVQDVCKNEAGVEYPFSSHDLNESFLSGKVVDLDALDFSSVTGLHQEICLVLKDKPQTIRTDDFLTEPIEPKMIKGHRRLNEYANDFKESHLHASSQNGEEGILEFILEKIGMTNKVSVEFGASDGVKLSNTAYFREHHGFHRILIEGGEWGNKTNGEKIVHSLVSPDNINELLRQEECPDVYDLLSLDIDGDDYWVWKVMEPKARVVILEYHCGIPNDIPIAILPNMGDVKSHLIGETGGWNIRSRGESNPNRFELNGYYGANLRAFYNLGVEKGYKFCTTIQDNAIFVASEEFDKLGLSEVSREECVRDYFIPISYWWENRDRHNRKWIVLEEK